MIRFNIERRASLSEPGSIGYLTKAAADQASVGVNYDRVLDEGDYFASVAVTAVLLSDRATDASSTIIDSSSLVNGTATGGSTTSLVQASNLSLLGLQPGDKLLNLTQNWLVKIKSFSTTTVHNDTFDFDTAPSAAAVSDAFKTGLITFVFKGGTAGLKYLIQIAATTNSGAIFNDQITLHVI